MQENKTVTIDAELWDKTQFQLFELRQLNAELMAKVRKLQSDVKKNGVKTRYSMTPITQQSQNLEAIEKKGERQKFKSEMIQSQNKLNKKSQKPSAIKIENRLRTVLSLIEQQKSQGLQLQGQTKLEKQNEQKNEKMQEIQGGEQKNKEVCQLKQKNSSNKQQMKLIESICLFGPSQQSILENLTQRRMTLPNSLLFSANKKQMEFFKVYGEYFYPEGQIAAKNLREQEAPTQINQIIFRKNTKKQDCALFLFRGDENNEKLKKENEMLERINPGKSLFAFFIQFSDYEHFNTEEDYQIMQNNNRSLIQHGEGDKNANQKLNGGQSQRIRSMKRSISQYVKGKYTLCIFTYFPIITVMEHLLFTILDQIKIKRVQKFAQSGQMKEVSIKFFINQLSEVSSAVFSQIEPVPCNFCGQVGINFGNVKIVFDLTQSKFDDLIYSGWVYDIAKIFEKDLIYELYTNMMIEQSICFVCENMHMLTYVIFFFVTVLTNPFYYPHPSISNICNYELLESPFVGVAGINQSSKWLQQNVSNYPKKIFVDLNEQIKIKGKKKPRLIKSEKLKKIFNTLYKKVESSNSPVPQLFKKKQTIIRPASKEQNLAAISFIKSLQGYYSQQIFVFLPNPAIITHIRDRIEETNETSKIYSILKQIEKYLRESRKHREKDQFIDLLVQQQIFYVYMGTKYKLD